MHAIPCNQSVIFVLLSLISVFKDGERSFASSSFVIDLGGHVLEPLELEEVLGILLLPDILRLDELLGLHLGARVPDFDVIATRLAQLFVPFDVFVFVLDLGCCSLAEVVVDDAVDWRLRSIRSAVGELILGLRYLLAAALERVHPERNTVIVTLSVFVVLRRRHVPIYNCLVVQQLEVARVVMFRVISWLVYFPGRANLRRSFLRLLVRSPICEMLVR